MKAIKKLATVLVILLASLGFVQPASAINVTPGTIPTGFTPMGTSAVYGTSVFVYGQRNTGNQHELIGYVVDFDGFVSAPHVFEDFTGRGLQLSSQPFIQLKNRAFAMTWATKDLTTRESVINVQISRDGETWGAVQHPAPNVIGAENNCSDSCGYLAPQIAQDPKGVISVAWANQPASDFAQPAAIGITTSTNATKWTTPVAYPVIETGPFPSVGLDYLIGLPQGGFAAIWSSGASYNTDVHYGTAFITGKGKKASAQGKFTQPPFTRSQGKLVKVSATKYVRFQATFDNAASTFTLCYQTLDTARKTWSKNIPCFPTQAGFIPEDGQLVSTDAAGNSVFFFSSEIWDNVTQTLSPTTFYMVKITNGVVANSIISAGSPGSSVFPISLARDVNNALLVTYLSGTTIKQSVIDNDQIQSTSNLWTTTLDNDIFYSATTGFNVPAIVDFNWESGTSVHFLMADSAPIASLAQVISGKAKVGSTLRSSLPSFSSPSGNSGNVFQWYSCGAKMFVHFNNIPTPGVCNPIPRATKATYKVRKQDKGYYIAVAVTNHNPIGSTTILSNATTKIK